MRCGCVLNGDVYSNFAGDTEYWWRYGETTVYGSETPHRTVAIDDPDPHPVSEPVRALSPSTTYHAQLCVRDQQAAPPRTNCSSDETFGTTAPGPAVTIAVPVSGTTLPEPVPIVVVGTCAAAAGDSPVVAVEAWRDHEKVSVLTVTCSLLMWSASFPPLEAGQYTFVAKQINTSSGLTGQSAGTAVTFVNPV